MKDQEKLRKALEQAIFAAERYQEKYRGYDVPYPSLEDAKQALDEAKKAAQQVAG